MAGLLNKPGWYQIRVYGEPQPFPKKDVAMVGKRMIPVDKDYRTRKNPITGKTEKYDRGYKRRWMEKVTRTVWSWMDKRGMEPYRPNHPIALGCLFFLTQPPSNRLQVPSQDPDLDNFEYAIWNALKRTPKKKGRDGAYPNGVLFYDDNQIISRVLPCAKLWATSECPPGVLITVVDVVKNAQVLGAEYNPFIENGTQDSLF